MRFKIKKKERLYFLINMGILLVLALLLVLSIHLLFDKARLAVEKEVLSSVAEIREKEGYSPLEDVNFESESDVTRALMDIKSKGYIVEKSFFWSEDMQDIMVFIIFVIAVSFILYFNYLFYLHEQKKYINNLDAYLDTIFDNKYNLKLEDSNDDMISKVNVRFNKLALALKRNYFQSIEDLEKLRDYLADISHQIKTPLTSLSLNNEIILDGDNLNEEQIEFLTISQGQIARLRWLTDALLKISKLDSHSVNFHKQEVLAMELTVGFEDVLKNQLNKNNLSLIRSGNMDLVLNVDFDWTREAILNIVKNATEHATFGSEIELKFIDNPSYQGIEIYNVGEPIPLENLSKIFERFYKSRNNNNPESIGIGLNLSKKIIEAQGGTISASNEIGKIKFSVLFLKI